MAELTVEPLHGLHGGLDAVAVRAADLGDQQRRMWTDAPPDAHGRHLLLVVDAAAQGGRGRGGDLDRHQGPAARLATEVDGHVLARATPHRVSVPADPFDEDLGHRACQ